ncbi:Cytochrome c oxidase subunit CcoP [Labilithrix luteola]|uniref:Cytochrome c oxidase subunit CcoP n=1 Tax=Labilithrix luteola TaxID=1391654 RepID=A0A0K1QE51_9BACT|nr:c-type cytochrome [Labilithrix luteola]AKV04039.1 Cytochrome c oxidase subunit CcoP [Labilithrix luteola]
MRLRRLSALVLALAAPPMAVAALVACKPASTSPSSGDAAAGDAASDASALNTLDGAALYGSLCAICHGADATGYKADNAPSLVNPTFLESVTDDQLRRSITDGRPGTSMAAYGAIRGGPLKPDAVNKVVGWIRSHGSKPISLPPRGTGDAKRGAQLYADSCERCHGTAKVRGNAVHLANPRFLEVASDEFLGWAIAKGRPGTPMEAWQGKLTDGQIDDVIAYVRAFNKPPPVELLPAPTGKEPLVINPHGQAPNFKPRSTPCPKTANQPDAAPCIPDERFVSVEQVKEALDQKRKIIIIDARPPSDWMRVHIPGAVSIPYHDTKRLEEIPNDGTWVIAYCACPHHLSGDVVDLLRKRGIKHASILDEGILEWHRRGYPVVAAPGVEAPPKEGYGLVPPSPAH